MTCTTSSNLLQPSPTATSPLSRPPIYAPTRTPSPSVRINRRSSQGQTPRPISIHGSSTASSRVSVPPFTPSPGRSSTPIPHSPPTGGGSTNPSPLSRSQPLLGSYALSLLHAPMCGHRPHQPTPGFTLHLGAVGKGKTCLKELRCPAHVVVPFEAFYYDLGDDDANGPQGKTPWVGSVDVQRWYFESYSTVGLPLQEGAKVPAGPPPVFPGYRVARRGQLQILIKTPEPSAAAKVFLVPYDLRRVPVGGRLLLREDSYVGHESRVEGEKEVLRYAIQLQFICLSRPCPDGGPPMLSYYVTKSLRVIFSISPLEKDETMRVERTEQMIEPSLDVEQGKRRSSGLLVEPVEEKWNAIRADWEMLEEGRKVCMPPLKGSPLSPTVPLPSSTTSILSRSRPTTPNPIIPPLTPTSHLPSLTTPPKAAKGPQAVTVWSPTGRRARREDEMEEKALSEKLRQLEMEKTV
ncbi:hypothetical protein L198_02011 [Cryptococcus wingfieldii CBS 7118]|uniref:Atos-like conserved domain-containing protein n=1 Tax=Cryptococcus wingfieldii CBS 7118 TaxID=1295528 RepID=A0A1E3JWS8_9TREE|nr:hypothetical protein L198_02011 [Cryptococcus wingfieldii CBS 7118]ODO05319.1 hypothetical protein L198_02011 [Cryptococcus wingfieldii CBS 7118]